MSSSTDETTQLLRGWTLGDADAGERLFARLYDEIRSLASRRRASESADFSLHTTALVSELYLRLIDQRQVEWQSRQHFFAIAARVMRRILVDHARRRAAEKRNHGVRPVSLENLDALSPDERPEQVLALERSLQTLEKIDADRARLVEMRFFGGLSLDETAEALGTSRASVVRRWRHVKGWIAEDMRGRSETPAP
ncbi:MAG: ECF-type sigma factor [Acidobacteriota bacterium]